MTAVRITKLERHERGFYTANVTAAPGDTVRVDSRIGCWTLPVDPKADFSSNQINRREILPEIAKALHKRVEAFKRGEAASDEPVSVSVKPNGRLTPKTPAPETTAQAIGRSMAEAGLEALKEAA